MAPQANKTTTNKSPFLSLRRFSSLLSARWSTFINKEVKTGLITNATNKDELNTMMSVIGRYFIKLPMIPGQKASGINAARVVAVEAIIGQATSPAPCFAASSGGTPCCI